MKKVNPIGQKFGKLTIKERILIAGPAKYLCLCDCGKTKIIAWSNLQSLNTSSCGCIKREYIQKTKLKPAEEVLVKQIRNYYKRNATNRSIQWLISDDNFRPLLLLRNSRRDVYCLIRN